MPIGLIGVARNATLAGNSANGAGGGATATLPDSGETSAVVARMAQGCERGEAGACVIGAGGASCLIARIFVFAPPERLPGMPNFTG